MSHSIAEPPERPPIGSVLARALGALLIAVTTLACLPVRADATTTAVSAYDDSNHIDVVRAAVADVDQTNTAQPSHGYDDAVHLAPTSARQASYRSAPNTTRELYKAPRVGDYDGQLARGWIPDETFARRPPDFAPDEPIGDSVFFTLNVSRARSIASGPLYDGRLIAVSVPADFLNSCDGPNDFDDNEDVEVPFGLLPILNTFPRRPA